MVFAAQSIANILAAFCLIIILLEISAYFYYWKSEGVSLKEFIKDKTIVPMKILHLICLMYLLVIYPLLT